MIIDSNIIIRLLRGDVPSQTKEVKEFFKKVDAGVENGDISILVLGEIIHVLGELYQIKRSDFIPEIIKILAIKDIRIIEAEKEDIIKILDSMTRNNIDFTDYYLVAIAAAEQIFSFDQDFKKMQSELLAKA